MQEYSKFSDQELVSFFKRDDIDAFTALYNRYQGLLFIYACKIVKDEDVAEDLVQEIFVYVWDKRHFLDFKSSVSAYLYSAVRYKFFDLVDSRKIRSDYVHSLQDYLDKGSFSTDDYIVEKEFAAIIEKEIANLPCKMQEIFVLSRKNNLTNKEISAILDISEKTVKNQISAALKLLRLRFGLFYFVILLIYR